MKTNPLLLLLFFLLVSATYGQVTIVTTALPNSIVAKPVSGAVWTLTAKGGTAPYTWAVSSGSLPTGLTLSAGGTISGTSTVAGAQAFTIRVTDNTTATTTKAFTITAQYAIGHGCTTATIIDWDCDYYGVGSAIGMDADDNDATVNTVASWRTKYGSGPSDNSNATLLSYLSTVRGYTPLHLWFVAPTGSDSACVVNDITNPCATWNGAYKKSAAGDAVILRNGAYSDPIWGVGSYYGPVGTAAHPSYFLGYPGEKPTLDRATLGFSGVSNGANPTGQNWTTIDGVAIHNSSCTPFWTASGCGSGMDLRGGTNSTTGVVIRNVEISGFQWGIVYTTAQTNTVIELSSISNAQEHPIYIGTNECCINTGVIVRNNLLYNAGRDNFHNNGRCNTCLLDSNIMYSANMAGGGGSSNVQFNQGWNHSKMVNNIVFVASGYVVSMDDYDDPWLGGCVAGTNCIQAFDQNYNLFAHNTFIYTGRSATGEDLSSSGFTILLVVNYTGQVRAVQPNLDLGHNTWQNNLFIQATSGTWANDGLVRYSKYDASDIDWLSTDAWTNNIFYASNGAAPLFTGLNLGAGQTWSYFATHAASFSGNLQSNPLLTAYDPTWYAEPEKYNLRPASGSPALGAGSPLGAPTTDITGAVRPNPPSIGAYERAVINPTANPCDLNLDGVVDVLDTQLGTAQALGTAPCTNSDLDKDGVCTVIDIVRIVNTVLGQTCLVGP